MSREVRSVASERRRRRPAVAASTATGRALALTLVATFAACTGDGSDIGPDLQRLPSATFRVLVRNDDDRGVANAFVRVSGGPVGAATRGNGRADVAARPGGRGTVSVDASLARAQDGDALVGLSIETDFDGADLPAVVYLPDVAPSQGLALTAGVQATSAVLDDSASSGAVLTVPVGTLVAAPGGQSILLRTGRLRPDHLPPVRFPGGGAALPARGICVAPVGVTFQTGATLSMPNDLDLPPDAQVPLLHLDPAAGRWREIGVGTVDTAGTAIVASHALRGGGLYTFAARAGAFATVIGRVLDADNRVVPGARVRAGQVVVRTDGNGRFVLPDVVAADALGRAREVTVTVHGGRAHRPSSHTVRVTLAPGGVVDLGDLGLDAPWVADLRMLLIARGRPAPLEALAAASLEGLAGRRGTTDLRGELTFHDFEAGLVTFLLTRPFYEDNVGEVLTAELTVDMVRGRRALDLRLFQGNEDWVGGNRSGTAMWIVDAIGHGFVEGAHVMRDVGNGDEVFERTQRFRLPRTRVGVGQELTAALATRASGRSVYSAFTVRQPLVSRVEMPLERAERLPLGDFDAFGLAAGRVPGSGTVRRVRVTRAIAPDEWLDAVLEGRAISDRMPRDLDPERDGGDRFRVGLPVPLANVAVVAGDTALGSFMLEGFRYVAARATDPRQVSNLAFDALLPATATFRASSAFAGRDPLLPAADFVFDLGVLTPNRGAVDVARGIAGNLAADGEDAVLTLPALSGELSGAEYLALLHCSSTAGGVTRSQASVLRLGTATVEADPLLPLPVLTTPPPSGALPGAGFRVEFTLPSEATYGIVHLRSERPAATFDWRVVVPPSATSCRFRRLPDGVPTPLAEGAFTLSVTAVRLADDSLARRQDFDVYQSTIARWVGLSAWERRVVSRSSVTVPVRIVP